MPGPYKQKTSRLVLQDRLTPGQWFSIALQDILGFAFCLTRRAYRADWVIRQKGRACPAPTKQRASRLVLQDRLTPGQWSCVPLQDILAFCFLVRGILWKQGHLAGAVPTVTTARAPPPKRDFPFFS